jgi:succinate dehydrogenase/fumarate reductase flavoprotein subunit
MYQTACSTGRWAGLSAAQYAKSAQAPKPSKKQIKQEKERIYQPSRNDKGINWKELAAGIAKVMQDYCGDVKNEELMNIGLDYLAEIRQSEATELVARNPHELMRAIEALDILTCSGLIIQACKARQASNSWINFQRSDYQEDDPQEWHKWVALKLENHKVKHRRVELDYSGNPNSIQENYKAHQKGKQE